MGERLAATEAACVCRTTRITQNVGPMTESVALLTIQSMSATMSQKLNFFHLTISRWGRYRLFRNTNLPTLIKWTGRCAYQIDKTQKL